MELAESFFRKKVGAKTTNATLNDICEITMGQSPAGSSLNEETGEVFYQGKTDFGNYFPTRRLFTTEPKRMAKENDILLSVRAPVGSLNIANENCCIGRGLAALHSPYTGFLFLTLKNLQPKFESFDGEGTVFGSINSSALRGLAVYAPTNEEMEEFRNFIEPIFKQIRTLADENSSLIELRDMLLPKLLSGETQLTKLSFVSGSSLFYN